MGWGRNGEWWGGKGVKSWALPASSIATGITSNLETTVYTLNATQVKRAVGRGWGGEVVTHLPAFNLGS